jgi:hypothetical protein
VPFNVTSRTIAHWSSVFVQLRSAAHPRCSRRRLAELVRGAANNACTSSSLVTSHGTRTPERRRRLAEPPPPR